jgi:hypothetical protein
VIKQSRNKWLESKEETVLTSSTYLIRLTRVLLLGMVVAAMAASAAAGSPTAQGLKADGLRLQGIARVYESLRAQASAPTPLGLKADGLRLQGIAQVYQRSQQAASAPTESLLSRPPDVQDAAAGIEPATTSTLVSRPPDISDAAQVARTVSFSKSSGFDWADYAMGIGSGMGLILVLAGGLAIGWQRRHRVQTA